MTSLPSLPAHFSSDLISHSALSGEFFAPLFESLALISSQRVCHQLSDADWLVLGVRRALESHTSGRGFLQHLLCQGVSAPQRSLFFETLKSRRRLALTAGVNQAVADRLAAPLDHPFGHCKELEGFDLYAGDGHFHAAAAHDRACSEDGAKHATGHFFALNLRTRALVHLAVADQLERKKEHDMRALKRMSIQTLRQGAPKGRKVLYVWDRAGIDFLQWHKWKQGSGIYFLSRAKDNMKLEALGQNGVDLGDPRNQGVLADEIVATSQGVSVRRITYRCPLTGQEFEFLTNADCLPPGVVAHLYRIRWEIEKAFDELKNKLEETKAWASSPNAKSMQAHFLCLAHNLMLLFEDHLDRAHGVRNEAELKRRAAAGERTGPISRQQPMPALPLLRPPAPHSAIGEVHPLAPGSALFPSLPGRSYRRPEAAVRKFMNLVLDTGGRGGKRMKGLPFAFRSINFYPL